MGETSLNTPCCIVGGGPAGLMLGYLLARAGVAVTVLEKHHDFLRDFRGELQGKTVTMADFSRLPGRCQYMMLMPQWNFLNFLAQQAALLPGFTLLRATRGVSLCRHQGRVVGVNAEDDAGRLTITTPLVIGTDGRGSMVRADAGLQVRNFGAPRDVVWMKLPKEAGDAGWASGHGGPKNNFIMLDRGDYWQCGYSIVKGSFDALQQQGLAALLMQVAAVAPVGVKRLRQHITDWRQVKLLDIRIDRLTHWAAPGVLCIGDAAHAMSPIGGVGVNLAIQDAVATANLLAKPLARGAVSLRELNRVQRRRQFPTRATQALQIMMTGKGHRPARPARAPSTLELWLRQRPWLPRLAGRIIGLGFRPERPRRAAGRKDRNAAAIALIPLPAGRRPFAATQRRSERVARARWRFPPVGRLPYTVSFWPTPRSAVSDSLSAQEFVLNVCEYTLPGMFIKEHRVKVPLDWSQPQDGRTLDLFVREVVDPRKHHQSLPKLAFLQGGPGGKGPRPQGGGPVWLTEALKTHRVILMDQRGTGRSSRVESATLASMDGQAGAAYLWHFRADSIVRDCEFLRTALFGGDRWETLGQSYGGFLILTYLSLVPEGLSASYVTGGLPGLDADADEVYRRDDLSLDVRRDPLAAPVSRRGGAFIHPSGLPAAV